MQTIIWAFGSTVVLFLILSFLPMGITFKGKFFVVFAGLLLALGGLAAAASFSLWQTLLILLVLVFLTAYIMDSRLGTLLYKEPLIIEEEIIEKEASFINHQSEKMGEIELLDLPEIESTDTSLNPTDFERFKVTLDKDADTEIGEEDISFLLERNVDAEIEVIKADSKLEVDYLSDFEGLLLEEEGELTSIKTEDKPTADSDDLDEFDFLSATKEAAADREDYLKESKSTQKVQLQK